MNETAKREKKEIVISENRDFKGVWIPERLYLTREFTPNEKFLLIEIYSLTKKKNRECFANNKHFSDFVGLKENTVQKMMLKFENAGYIKRNYEYRVGTKEIERRKIKLTQKFYDDFINETENADSSADGMENNPDGYGVESTDHIENNPQGSGLKVGDKYNNFKSNNDLSNTDLSTKAETLSKDNAEADTNSLKKSLPAPVKKKTKSELKELEKDMVKRFAETGDRYDVSNTAFKNIVNAFARYCKKYTERTGKVHPILKDKTLENIFVTLATISDTEYSHFENVADYEPDSDGLSYLDEMVDEHFDANHGDGTDWHISHFAQSDYLEKMAQHIVEW